MYRCTLILCALLATLALTACDRGNQLFDDAKSAEAEGNLEEARANYLAIVRLLPDSTNSEEARTSFVRITLDLAEDAMEVGNVERANHLLAQAEPLHEGDEGRRLNALAANIHQALEERDDAADDLEEVPAAVTDAVTP